MRHRQARNRKNCLRKDDRGASLIAVIVALVFVITIGAITMEITATNIRMSGIELSTKKNFYSAESVMEELKRELAEEAARIMRDAIYYATPSVSAGDVPALQQEFITQYMEGLEEYFTDSVHTSPVGPPGESYYVGTYLPEKVTDVMPAGSVGYLYIPTVADRIFTIDYNNGRFTLKNLLVIFDDGIYKTSISTDLVFSVPPLVNADVSSGDMFPDGARIGDYLTYENWTKNEE